MSAQFFSESESTPSAIRGLLMDRIQESELTVRMGQVLQRWIRYADESFKEWPGRDNCGYFFGGSYWYELETAYTAIVYAVVGKVGQYDETLTGLPREQLIAKAIKSLRYLCFTHDTGPEECVRVEGRNPFCSSKKWGGRGDDFFKASQTGTSINAIGYTAWFLWEDLDQETRNMIEAMLVYYADRWSDELPRNGVYFNTQCEENAWTSAGIGAAVALFPDHPRNGKWKEAAERWAINSVSTVQDATLRRPQVSTVTFHPDFTSENHAFVHPSYMMAGISLRGMYSTFNVLSGDSIAEAFLLNNEQMYAETIKKWSLLDGYPVPVQGQDWWYNRQHEALMAHALMNVQHQDSDAALLERRALDYIERIQASNSRGCMLEENGEECIVVAASFQTAVDMEFASAHSVVMAYLLHLFGGSGAAPTDSAVFQSEMNGVSYYPYGSIVTHRTNITFSSFSWRSHVMALTLPEQAMWSITPLYTSYTGEVSFAGELPSAAFNESVILQAAEERVHLYEDGFGVTASIHRGANRQMNQQIGFVSLPNGSSVYAEQIEINRNCEITRLATGVIGIRNERYTELPKLASGTKTIHTPQHSQQYKGFYGKEPNGYHAFEAASYVNVNEEIGYVTFGSQGMAYLNQHEYPKWKGVEDVLTLNLRQELHCVKGEQLPAFVVLSLPNYSVEATAATAASTSLLSVNIEKCIVLESEDFLTVIYNGNHTSAFSASKYYLPDHPIQLFEGRQIITNTTLTRYGTAAPGDAYYKRSLYSVELNQQAVSVLSKENHSLTLIVTDNHITVSNESDQEVHFTLRDKLTGISTEARLDAGLTCIFKL
ncbi:MAG: putative secreted protein [Paenibacillus sp.]|nr:putative secreted protein [Paenibacillus sp.]